MSQEIHLEEANVAEDLDGDAWMNCMKESLLFAGSDGPKHGEHLIYKVHSDLRNEENASFYEPIATSIGPYHCGRKHLQGMETHKKRYLRHLLRRNGDDVFEDLVKKMEDIEDRARDCYPEKFELKSKAFVKMMLLDGCFIVELLLKITYGNVEFDDLFVGPAWRSRTLVTHDLLLLENQLPFFLLQEIFQFVMPIVMPNETDPKQALVKLSLKFLKYIALSETLNEEVILKNSEPVHHLLHLWHTHLIQYAAERRLDSVFELEPDWMPGVKQLEEAGVTFKASSSNLLDINFCKRQMIIPKIFVHVDTETQLRNLIAFEQCCLGPCQYYVSSYVQFLDDLINTSKDVKILREKGILKHGSGDDEQVVRLFSNLTNGVLISRSRSYLSDTYWRVNKYSSTNWHKWRARLARDYFYDPWAVISNISYIAAILALILTGIQTFYSVSPPKH